MFTAKQIAYAATRAVDRELRNNDINSKRVEFIILDDPLNEENMNRTPNPNPPLYAGYGQLGVNKAELAPKPAKVNYNTIGVRFLDGNNIAKVYTYGVRKGGKLHLGQELVADTARGPALVAVVRIDKTPAPVNPAWPNGLQFLTRKVVEL